MSDKRHEPGPVEISGVTKRYGNERAADDVSLSVGAGESLALLGHNGAGKTTLIKTMLGLTHADSGDIRILGEDPRTRAGAQARRDVGFLPENVTFPIGMTGRELLRFYARLKRAPRKQCDALLEELGLAHAANRRIRTYSKGMRQRLGLAQALIGKPRLLLLDEPTSGLDPTLRHDFYEIIHRLAKSGTAVMLSSHALTEVEAQTDRIAILKSGKLVACGTMEELRQISRLPVTIRVRVGNAESARRAAELSAATRRINDHAVELVCEPDGKVALVREIMALGIDLEDIDIHSATLERLYTHYRGEATEI